MGRRVEKTKEKNLSKVELDKVEGGGETNKTKKRKKVGRVRL